MTGLGTVDLPALEALIFAELNPGSVRVVERVGMRAVGRLPLVGHHLSEERARETMGFDIWRVRNAPPGSARSVLAKAAFRIGQLLGEGAWSRCEAVVGLSDAAERSGLIGEFDGQTVRGQIEEQVTHGMAAKGISHFRVRRHEYPSRQRSSGK